MSCFQMKSELVLVAMNTMVTASKVPDTHCRGGLVAPVRTDECKTDTCKDSEGILKETCLLIYRQYFSPKPGCLFQKVMTCMYIILSSSSR